MPIKIPFSKACKSGTIDLTFRFTTTSKVKIHLGLLKEVVTDRRWLCPHIIYTFVLGVFSMSFRTTEYQLIDVVFGFVF